MSVQYIQFVSQHLLHFVMVYRSEKRSLLLSGQGRIDHCFKGVCHWNFWNQKILSVQHIHFPSQHLLHFVMVYGSEESRVKTCGSGSSGTLTQIDLTYLQLMFSLQMFFISSSFLLIFFVKTSMFTWTLPVLATLISRLVKCQLKFECPAPDWTSGNSENWNFSKFSVQLRWKKKDNSSKF